MKPANLTQREIPLLRERYNLADGHVHRPAPPALDEFLDTLPQLFRDTKREELPELEEAFLGTFYTLAGQTRAESLLCTSASQSLEIVANYLRSTGKILGLIEPCFDNLHDIFRRHDIPLTRIPDTLLSSDKLVNYLSEHTTDAICIVTPNNPTGERLDRRGLIDLADHCAAENKTLILDTTFRFYDPEPYDQYSILERAGIDYMVIEDTGKTWPTHELKASILAHSKSLHDDLYRIHSDFVLHLSPITLQLLTASMNVSKKCGLKDIREPIQKNRQALYNALQGSDVTPVEAPYMSVAWLSSDNASQVHAALTENGIHVLPGNEFFWSNRSKGDKYLRVALARDTERFQYAAKQIESALHNT